MRRFLQIILLVLITGAGALYLAAGDASTLLSLPKVSWLRADTVTRPASPPLGPTGLAAAAVIAEVPGEVSEVLRVSRGMGHGVAFGALQTAALEHRATRWRPLLTLAAARRALEAGSYGTAVRLSLDPDLQSSHLGGHALLLRAAVHEERREWDAAARLLGEAAEGWPGSPASAEARIRRVTALVAAGRGDEALEEVERLEPLAPVFVEEDRVLFLRARAYRAQGLTERAHATLDALYFRHPTSRWNATAARLPWRERRAASLHRAGVPMVERLARADALFEKRWRRAALKEYENILRLHPGQGDPDRMHLRAGTCAWRLRRSEAALDHLRSVGSSRRELFVEALYTEGLVRRRQKRHAEFLRAMERAANLDPTGEWRARAMLEVGDHLEDSDPGAAREAYRKAAEAGPGTEAGAEARWRLGWADYLGYDFGSARKQFLDLARDGYHPHERAAGIFWAAKAEMARGNRVAAQTCLERAAERFPNDFYGMRARQLLGRPIDEDPISLVPPAGGDPVLQDLRSLAGRLAPGADVRDCLLRIRDLAAAGEVEEVRREIDWLEGEMGPRPEIDGLRLEMHARQDDHLAALIAFRKLYPEHRSRLDIPEARWRAVYPRRFLRLVEANAREQGLDTDFVLSVIHQESVFDPGATSHAGARGLMQIMPSTGRSISRSLEEPAYSTARLYEPELNVRFGTWYLADLLEDFQGRPELALAGYNAGGGRVKRWTADARCADPDVFIESIPFDETRNYVKRILNNVALYKRLYAEEAPAR